MINKNRKYTTKRNFTLIEVLAAMAVFVVLVSVMMQFFTSARNLWLASNRRTDLYSNAGIALDMMTRDLQSALYNNDNSNQGIYPFWFRTYNQSGDAVKELNFITATDLKPSGAKSDICELRYTYVKTASSAVTDDSGTNIDAGWLVRSCIADNSAAYDFMNYPFKGAASTRLANVWQDSSKYKKVIPGVISLDFICYADSLTDITAQGSSNKYGTAFPKIVKITIVLMDPDSWAKYHKIVGKDSIAAAKLKRSASRTFSRTIYLEQ